jgi:hypothetical protein
LISILSGKTDMVLKEARFAEKHVVVIENKIKIINTIS